MTTYFFILKDGRVIRRDFILSMLSAALLDDRSNITLVGVSNKVIKVNEDGSGIVIKEVGAAPLTYISKEEMTMLALKAVE